MILVVSIVIQSLTTGVLAANDTHQMDLKHLQTQHDHHNDTKGLDATLDSDGHEIKDCHHCGHCSGSHLSWVLVQSTEVTTKLALADDTPYRFIHSKEFLDAILRPPIS